jgi:hypothetical protein
VGLADSLGRSDCVKSSLVAMSVSAGATAKGVDVCRHGSQEAPAKRVRSSGRACHYSFYGCYQL